MTRCMETKELGRIMHLWVTRDCRHLITMEIKDSNLQTTMGKEGIKHLTIMEIWVFRHPIIEEELNTEIWECRLQRKVMGIWVSRLQTIMTTEVSKHHPIPN